MAILTYTKPPALLFLYLILHLAVIIQKAMINQYAFDLRQ